MTFKPLLILTLLGATAVPSFAQTAGETLRLDLNAPAPEAATPESGIKVISAAPAEATPDVAAQPALPQPSATPSAPASTGVDVAQSASPEDKDHMIACSIVYQRVSDMYRDRGETANADSFLSTAYAYSQTSDILYTQELGAEGAYDAMTQRMSLVSESLNTEAQGYTNGDLGVIEKWLGWCDERGEFVQNIISEQAGVQQ